MDLALNDLCYKTQTNKQIRILVKLWSHLPLLPSSSFRDKIQVFRTHSGYTLWCYVCILTSVLVSQATSSALVLSSCCMRLSLVVVPIPLFAIFVLVYRFVSVFLYLACHPNILSSSFAGGDKQLGHYLCAYNIVFFTTLQNYQLPTYGELVSIDGTTSRFVQALLTNWSFYLTSKLSCYYSHSMRAKISFDHQVTIHHSNLTVFSAPRDILTVWIYSH